MKAMRKSLERMMSHSSVPTSSASSACHPKRPVEAEALPDPEKLEGLELFYQLFKEDGDEMVGNPSGVFAAYNRDQGKLIVFAEDDAEVGKFLHRTHGLLVALDYARQNNAAFSVVGAQVFCEMGKVSAMGASYGEAALRALLKYLRQERGAEAGEKLQ
jgi:hypothetical protein